MKKHTYKVGDHVLGTGAVRPSTSGVYSYEVLAVEELLRFGKPAQLLTVNVYANTHEGREFIEKTTRWDKELY